MGVRRRPIVLILIVTLLFPSTTLQFAVANPRSDTVGRITAVSETHPQFCEIDLGEKHGLAKGNRLVMYDPESRRVLGTVKVLRVSSDRAVAEGKRLRIGYLVKPEIATVASETKPLQRVNRHYQDSEQELPVAVGTVSHVGPSILSFTMRKSHVPHIQVGNRYGVFRPKDGHRIVTTMKVDNVHPADAKGAGPYSNHGLPESGDIVAPLPNDADSKLAHVPVTHFREWTDYRGRRVYARLVGHTRERIDLQPKKGNKFTVRLSQLSEKDIRYVKNVRPFLRAKGAQTLAAREADRSNRELLREMRSLEDDMPWARPRRRKGFLDSVIGGMVNAADAFVKVDEQTDGALSSGVRNGGELVGRGIAFGLKNADAGGGSSSDTTNTDVSPGDSRSVSTPRTQDVATRRAAYGRVLYKDGVAYKYRTVKFFGFMGRGFESDVTETVKTSADGSFRLQKIVYIHAVRFPQVGFAVTAAGPKVTLPRQLSGNVEMRAR